MVITIVKKGKKINNTETRRNIPARSGRITIGERGNTVKSLIKVDYTTREISKIVVPRTLKSTYEHTAAVYHTG